MEIIGQLSRGLSARWSGALENGHGAHEDLIPAGIRRAPVVKDVRELSGDFWNEDGMADDFESWLRAERFGNGLPISIQDAWIATSTVRYKIPLITHNPADFISINGLTVIMEL